MPRPKGSKNKKTLAAAVSVETIDECILSAEREIAALGEQLRHKRAERRALLKTRQEKLRLAEEQKSAQEKQAVLDAMEKSGRSTEEILAFLQQGA